MSFSAGQNQTTSQSTIHDAIDEWELKYWEAVAGSDITGVVTGTLLRFLNEPSLPVFYQMKAYLVLSAADEENEPWENRRACRYYLREAEIALEQAEKIYVQEDEVELLKRYKQVLEEEQQSLREREQLADSD